MEITLAPEDQQRISRLIAQGLFASPADAVSVSLTLLEADLHTRTTSPWTEPPIPFSNYEVDFTPYLRKSA